MTIYYNEKFYCFVTYCVSTNYSPPYTWFAYPKLFVSVHVRTQYFTIVFQKAVILQHLFKQIINKTLQT